MNAINLKEFLTKVYHVPFGQRPYSWEENDVNCFYNSIKNIYTGRFSRCYINGVVVLEDSSIIPGNHKTNTKYYLYDGQQRTCTTLIIISAICAELKLLLNTDNLTEQDKRKIEGKLSSLTINYIKDDDKYKFFPYEDNREFFHKHIQDFEPFSNEKDITLSSNKRIYKAHQIIKANLKQDLSNYDSVLDKYTFLTEFVSCLLEQFYLMQFETNNKIEAKMIFNSINNSGKKLKEIDILKNLLILHFDESKVKEAWNVINQYVTEEDYRRLVKYTLDMMESQDSITDLNKRVELLFNDESFSDTFIYDFIELAKIYSALKNPAISTYFQGEYADKIKGVLMDLKSLNSSNYYPFIMAMYLKNYSSKDIYKALTFVEIYNVRNQFILRESNKSIENCYINLARNIFLNNISIENIANIIKENILKIPNATFKDTLLLYSPKKTAVSSYILRKINETMMTEEVIVVSSRKDVNIEHIMPKNNSIWQIDEELHTSYVDRLGNLTLLSGSINRNIKNDKFEVKKNKYKESQIPMTRALIDYDSWTVDNIVERQRQLTEIALTIWNSDLVQ